MFPEFAAFDPANEFVGSGTTTGNASTFTAQSTGTYSIVVQDLPGQGIETGFYDLYFARIPGANEAQLENGGVLRETLDNGDIDSFTFLANDGQSVHVSIGDTSDPRLAPIYNVYDPTGTFLGRGDSIGNNITFSVNTPGVHTVVIQDRPGIGARNGTYDFIWRVFQGLMTVASYPMEVPLVRIWMSAT